MSTTARPDPTARAVRTATFAAAAIIAQQVGAKATRDALFLANFDVDLLPRVVAASVLLALPTVLLASRSLARFTPARTVPVAFVVSAVLQLGYAGLATRSPGWAAIAFYFHVACFGALLVSGFWSVVNERFDPNTARRQIGRIGTGATLGGVAGGLLAAGVGRAFGDASLLPLLAGLHLLAAFACARTGRGGTDENGDARDTSPARGFAVIAAQPYLRLLVTLLVILGVGAVCLDFVFKEFAQHTFADAGRGPFGLDLVGFFGVYYTALSLLTFVLQGILARALLVGAGLARTVATLPAGMGIGALVLLVAPMWPIATLARGLEAALRSSLFRSAYELLYTPLPPADKRASKAIVDVGGERLGDAAGAGLVQIAILLLPAAAFDLRVVVLVSAAVTCAAIALVLTRWLHAGYVESLEDSLRRRHVALHPDEELDGTTRTLVMRTPSGPPGPETRMTPPSPAAASPAVRPARHDPLVALVTELRSSDPRRVMRALATHTPLDRALVGHVVDLLAWDAVAEEAIDALRTTGRSAAGMLLDAVLDPEEDFAIRRRAARAIGGPLDATVREGLLQGLRADRFEIRFQCARSLSRLRATSDPGLPADRVLERVLAEVSLPAGVWDGHRLLDRHRSDPLLDRASQAPAALQNVFALLSLVLPTEPLEICLRGVLSDDPQMRGTAIEYLESVLPASIREPLLAHLERTPRVVSAVTTEDAVDQSSILRTHIRTLGARPRDVSGGPS